MIGNYVPKAIESMTGWKGIEYTTGGRLGHMKGSKESATKVINSLEEAVCWTINHDALPMVWNTDFREGMDGMRLPYPTMAVEYEFAYEALGYERPSVSTVMNTLEAKERLIVLTETADQTGFTVTSMYRTKDYVTKGKVREGKFRNNLPEWMVSILAVTIPYEGLDCVGEWFTAVTKDNFTVNYRHKHGPRWDAAVPMYADIAQSLSREDQTNLLSDMGDELRVTLGLLGVLMCDNAPVDEVKAPTKLNKKRAKKGKPALRTYRTLRVSSHKRGSHRGATGSGGTKRAHWRRGHIRNQPTAKGYVRKWIRPCIVTGNGGAAVKPEIVLT